MDSFGSLDNFWDISQHPSSFPTLAEDDFLALLQKQFPTSNLFELNPADGIDPINISSLPLPNPTPPSTDSSPSPPSVNQEPTLSRRQSGVFSSGAHRSLEEDSSLKRKASSESIDDEPMHKNAHTGMSLSHVVSQQPLELPIRCGHKEASFWARPAQVDRGSPAGTIVPPRFDTPVR